MEDVLAKSGVFSLPGKKALLKDGMDCEAILVDATETPIERPKKTAETLFGQEEAARRKNAGGGEEIRRTRACSRYENATKSAMLQAWK